MEDGEPEIEYVEEFYGARIIKPQEDTDFEVHGRRFDRTVYREKGELDMLVDQVVKDEDDDLMYKYGEILRSWGSREAFYAALLRSAPAMNDDVITDLISRNKLDYGWSDVAQFLSSFADSEGAFNSIRDESGALVSPPPFSVQCVQAFGTISVLSRERGCNRLCWDPNETIPPSEPDTTCSICLIKYTFNKEHQDSAIKLRCRHVYHKKCIYDWIWERNVDEHVDAKCPNCNRFIFWENHTPPRP